MNKTNREGLTVKKEENFSEWYQQIIEKADITDIRYNVKGFVVIKPWGAMLIEGIYDLFEKELQKRGHKPVFFPTVIPENNFKTESKHVKGFTPQVFWLEKTLGEERLALRPTSETAFYKLYSLWIRSHRDLPLKIYQRANIFRNETKATRPLIRAREFYWIEAHDCFATKEQAEAQVQEDIQITEKVMHQKLGIPFLPMKRPEWDKFAGAVYTIGSDVLMPDGKLIQQPSTHLLGQNFSKPFNIKFKDEKEKEEYVWQTCYGPAMSRILASLISIHGDDTGLILPFCVSPVQIVIIPIFRKENKEKVIKEAEKIKKTLEKKEVKVETDLSEKRPGEKYYEWELKGVPFRIELGENEIKKKEIILFSRDTKKREKISLKDLEKIKEFGEKFDKRILAKADKFAKEKITECKTKEEIGLIVNRGGIAKANFCSIDKEGEKCAEYIEKNMNAEIRGIMANKKEKSNGKCIVCGKSAKEVVYIGRAY
ncbi:MAG: proline--tRNA ligase [archaeon]